jgi:hypothetical protein
MKKLAKISRATLEIKQYGMLNFWIYVDYEEGSSQGIGGIPLDRWDEDKQDRVGTAHGCEIIRRLLLALNVDDFSQMKGKLIWVHGDGDGQSFHPTGIEALKVDNPRSEPVVFWSIIDEMCLHMRGSK